MPATPDITMAQYKLLSAESGVTAKARACRRLKEMGLVEIVGTGLVTYGQLRSPRTGVKYQITDYGRQRLENLLEPKFGFIMSE